MTSRRTLQYSARSLLIIVAVVALALGLLASHVQQKKAEMEAIRVIWKSGGMVRIGKYHLGGTSDGLARIPANSTLERWCRDHLGENFFMSVESVTYWTAGVEPRKCANDSIRFDDELIASLRTLPSLKVIRIECPHSIQADDVERARAALPNISIELDDMHADMEGAPVPPPWPLEMDGSR